MNDEVKGKFYSQQLTKAPNPNNNRHFFEIEKVLKKKVIKKKNIYTSNFCIIRINLMPMF